MEQSTLIEVMAKHLPPSASKLQLLDVGGAAGVVLSARRPDLDITLASISPNDWEYSPDSVDSVVAYDYWFNSNALTSILKIMRAGGRLIVILPNGTPDQSYVEQLEQIGYTRILVESATGEDGVLIRGEKPHTTSDTLQRIGQVANQETDGQDLQSFKGRYVHLLIQQQPNKPVWKLTETDVITWGAVAILSESDTRPILLAFTSLPKAVGFMQPAVMQGVIQDVNKVGKFRRNIAQSWHNPVWLNPTLEQIVGEQVQFVSIDPETAEVPDE